VGIVSRIRLSVAIAVLVSKLKVMSPIAPYSVRLSDTISEAMVAVDEIVVVRLAIV
jgi:hypothetical protein